jgi:hypothetical protein
LIFSQPKQARCFEVDRVFLLLHDGECHSR